MVDTALNTRLTFSYYQKRTTIDWIIGGQSSHCSTTEDQETVQLSENSQQDTYRSGKRAEIYLSAAAVRFNSYFLALILERPSWSVAELSTQKWPQIFPIKRIIPENNEKIWNPSVPQIKPRPDSLGFSENIIWYGSTTIVTCYAPFEQK